jgi:hypothetical protein
MKVNMFFFVLFLIAMISAADNHGDNHFFVFNSKKAELITLSSSQVDSVQNAAGQKKSVFKAAMFSAIVPGTGEYYAGSFWKAAIFSGLEVLGWTVNIIYDNKGDKQDRKARIYADQNWDERKYWTKIYEQAVESSIWEYEPLQVDEIDDRYNTHLISDEDYNPETVQRLREMESDQVLNNTHQLPEKKSQQYYEMIYKYPEQFACGWDDAYFDYPYSSREGDLPGTLLHYRDMYNKTEDLYAVASTAVNAIILNHVISMIDAALTTRSYNRSLKIHASIQNKYYFNERVQMFTINVCW